jgi:uncharacterized membrane protein YhaH (DUF805 family)
MNLPAAISSCFRQYVALDGRAPRSEYWYFHLFCGLAIIAGLTLRALDFLIALGLTLPLIAVNVRRLHDVDRSGWMIFIAVIPFIGPLLLLIWHCNRGTLGDNRFGPDPLFQVG